MFEGGKNDKTSLDRRQFLKGMAAFGAGGLLPSSRAEAQEQPPHYEFLSNELMVQATEGLLERFGYSFYVQPPIIKNPSYLVDGYNQTLIISFNLNGTDLTMPPLNFSRNRQIEDDHDLVIVSEGGFMVQDLYLPALMFLFLEENGFVKPL